MTTSLEALLPASSVPAYEAVVAGLSKGSAAEALEDSTQTTADIPSLGVSGAEAENSGALADNAQTEDPSGPNKGDNGKAATDDAPSTKEPVAVTEAGADNTFDVDSKAALEEPQRTAQQPEQALEHGLLGAEGVDDTANAVVEPAHESVDEGTAGSGAEPVNASQGYANDEDGTNKNGDEDSADPPPANEEQSGREGSEGQSEDGDKEATADKDEEQTTLERPRVQVYGSTVSGNRIYKRQAKELFTMLEAQEVDFEFICIAADEQAKKYLRRKALGNMTIPQIYVDGELRGFYDDAFKANESDELYEWLGLDEDPIDY